MRLVVASLLIALLQASLASAKVEPNSFEFSDAISDKRPTKKGGSGWRMAAVQEELRWTNATIPYQYSPMAFNAREIAGLKEAMQVYMNETCLVFRPAEESDPYSIIIRDGGGGCNAILGMDRKMPGARAQTVNLADGCRFYGLFLHELGHVIGLHHEHQHPDRDQGVHVTMDNVDNTMKEWFELIDRKTLNFYDVPYDIQSIMHYEETAFGGRGEDGQKMITIQTHDPELQRYLYHVYMKDLSFGDVKRINAMYRCNRHCPPVKCPPEGFVNKRCQCATKQAFAKRRCFNRYSDEVCESRRSECDGRESHNLYDMFVNCRKTCDRCYKPM